MAGQDLLFIEPNASAPASIAIEFSEEYVRAKNVTPRAEIVCFARSVQYQGGVPHLTRHLAIVRDEDGDGVVTCASLGAPPLSVWTATDVESGQIAVAGPGSFAVRPMELPADAWRGGTAYVDVSRDSVDAVLVRPHVGVWRLYAFEGGALDDDATSNATLRARLSRMKPERSAPPPPPTATPHDVLILIDPRSLEVFVRAAQ